MPRPQIIQEHVPDLRSLRLAGAGRLKGGDRRAGVSRTRLTGRATSDELRARG